MSYINLAKSRRREMVRKMLDLGKSDDEIAYLTEYSISWVHRLRARFEKDNTSLAALRQSGGSRCRLSAEQLERLRTILSAGAESYDLEGSLWDRKRVKYVIKKEFDVAYNAGHIGQILARLNFTLQKPLKKDFRQKEADGVIWTEETLSEIKKSSARPGQCVTCVRRGGFQSFVVLATH